MKLLKEMYEGINYKGYTIEYNLDGLERAKQELLNKGSVSITITVFVVDNKGNRVYMTTKGIADAKKWIDENSRDEALDLYNHLLNDSRIEDENYAKNWYSIKGVDDIIDLIDADASVLITHNRRTNEIDIVWDTFKVRYVFGDEPFGSDTRDSNTLTKHFKNLIKNFKNGLINQIRNALNNK